MPDTKVAPESYDIIAVLTSKGLRIAVAESLTGGLLVAELIKTPGASAAVNGGVVAYHTELKSTVLGVDPALIAREGVVNAEVAIGLARNVRDRLAVEGKPADIGISTTGVAGPDPQDGHPPGTVFLALSVGDLARARQLTLAGTRDEIRSQTVREALSWLAEVLERGLADSRE